MQETSIRKCSNCGQNGHNSRACNEKPSWVMLFGVPIAKEGDQENFMKKKKKSLSLGNLQSRRENNNGGGAGVAFLSEGEFNVSNRVKAAHERKKGHPWTQEEHRAFLEGLKHLGKGDWRGISRNYVTTRTSIQVASHAQKYFLRQAANDKMKRRPSMFDMDFQEHDSISSRTSSLSKENSSSHNDPVKVASSHGQGFLEGTTVTFSGGHGYMTSFMAHPPSRMSVRDQQSMFESGDGSSSAKSDLLELRLGPPQSATRISTC